MASLLKEKEDLLQNICEKDEKINNDVLRNRFREEELLSEISALK